MAVYNEGFPRRAASSTGGRSADRTSGPFSALAFIVLFVYSDDDGDGKTPDRESIVWSTPRYVYCTRGVLVVSPQCENERKIAFVGKF